MERTKRDVAERFWEKVDKSPGYGPKKECWIWTADVNEYGYGAFFYQGKNRPAHLISLFLATGEFPPKGMQADHLCRVRNCVRPSHLEIVTQPVNIARGMAGVEAGKIKKQRKFCKNGHEFTLENTRVYEYKEGYTARLCRTCIRESRRKTLAKNREKYNQRKRVKRWQQKHPSK